MVKTSPPSCFVVPVNHTPARQSAVSVSNIITDITDTAAEREVTYADLWGHFGAVLRTSFLGFLCACKSHLLRKRCFGSISLGLCVIRFNSVLIKTFPLTVILFAAQIHGVRFFFFLLILISRLGRRNRAVV